LVDLAERDGAVRRHALGHERGVGPDEVAGEHADPGLAVGHPGSSPLAVPTAVFSPCWFSHQTSTTTRVRPPSARLSLTTPWTVSWSPARTGLMKVIDMVPPRTKPAPTKRVISSDTYAVDIIACARQVGNPLARAQLSSV